MSIKTQIKLEQLTGSLGDINTKAGQVSAGSSAGLAANDMNDVLGHMAAAIKRIHGNSDFTSAEAGMFYTDVTPDSDLGRSLGSAGLRWDDLFLGGDAAVGGNVTIDGNLTVAGSTTTLNTENLTIQDSIIGLGVTGSGEFHDSGDRAILFARGEAGQALPTFWWDGSEFKVAKTATAPLSGSVGAVSDYATMHVGAITLDGHGDLKTYIDNADSTINASIAAGDSSIKVLMEAADASLTTRVSTEESTRLAADGSLTTRVAAEESARLAGDDSLEAFVNEEVSILDVVDAFLTIRVAAEEFVCLAAVNSLVDVDGSL